MTWFDIPSDDYFCITRQNDTTLYGYQGNRRDTFTLNGFEWQKTATASQNTMPSNLICVSDPQIPSTVQTGLIVGGVLIALGFFVLASKIVRRSYL